MSATAVYDVPLVASVPAAHDAIVAGLQDHGEVLKQQQALLRSCMSAESSPDELARLDALLRLLTTMRRRQRVLLRLWRGVLTTGVPTDLVEQSMRFAEELADVDALVETHRSRALGESDREGREGWQLLLDVARRHLPAEA